jgi:hypothetical protein
MSRIVSINPADLALTATDLAELRRVAQLPDSAIDYSDIPPTSEADWKDAVPGHLYQSRLNAVLREAMLRDLKKKRQSA